MKKKAKPKDEGWIQKRKKSPAFRKALAREEAYERDYRLPGGGTTKSVRRYTQAWRRLAKPICERMQWSLVGFDPDLQFYTGKPGNNSRSVTPDLALFIYELVTGLTYKP